MLPEIKMTIIQDDKRIHKITKEVNEAHFVDCLVEFQSTANDLLTKMINDLGDAGGDCDMEEEDSESDEEQVSPKKKKN